jgi:diguanylate cyclase (GGDEF)-like protein
VSGRPEAVIALFAGEFNFFDDEELKLLTELAGDISFAVDHIEKQDRLNYLAYYDSLTGLANRALFIDRLAQHIESAKANGLKVAVLLLNVDRFKLINDSLGRQAGDELLKQIAARLTHDFTDQMRHARISADTFAIAVPEAHNAEEVARRIEGKLRDYFSVPFRIGDAELRIAARVGAALFPDDGIDAEVLFRNAEAALKKAKLGGEKYLFFTPHMSARVSERLSLENNLRRAIGGDEFVLHYQPKVNLDTRRITGVEALIRWNDPRTGLVPPFQFISLLEETGLILEVGAWALGRAARDHRHWVELGLTAPRIAVNVSPIQLRQRDFVEVVQEAVKAGVSPTGIDLEITESLIMEDVTGNIEKLDAIRDLGMSIAIDDFGTGYSSLGYLAKLPVQSLKIDRSFIINMLDEPDTMTLVSTIISLAHSLRLKVVAEGVEEEEQAKMLRLLRCDQMQGYLFSKPVPRDDLTALLRAQTKV